MTIPIPTPTPGAKKNKFFRHRAANPDSFIIFFLPLLLRSGFYDYCTFDQNAFICTHPQVGNLTVLTGFSGHGLQQSQAAGRAGAELLVEGKTKAIDLSMFGLERVLKGKEGGIWEEGIV